VTKILLDGTASVQGDERPVDCLGNLQARRGVDGVGFIPTNLFAEFSVVTSHEPPPHSPSPDSTTTADVSLDDLQTLIRRMYFEKDQARGIEGTFMWFMEEVGELSAALRSGTHQERLGEFADVLAWLTTLANVAGVRLSDAVAFKYGAGCPGCGQFACQCAMSGKP